MKNIVLFDVDGTIAESGQNIGDEMKEIIEELSKKI
jgi:hydroxymethylpyrimidine pyrophosphatase-like HAD family hydrolase